MREGMKGKAGIGKLALYGREYLVAVQPKENGLVMYTLRHAKEVRSMDAIDELQTRPVEGQAGRDQARQAGDRELRRGAEPARSTATSTRKSCSGSSTRRSPARKSSRPTEEAPPKVVNLMDALRQSLDRVSTGKKKAAKADMAEKPEKAVAAPKKRAAR